MENPKIRFKGFTKDWEQRKFKELCDMVTVGIANSATHAYSDSGVVMFRNQNIKPNFLDDTDIIHINSEFEVKYKNKRLKKNDLLVARTGYPGTACVVPEKYENSQTFTTLIARPNENVDPYFLCQYLNSDIGIKYFESTQIGGGQKNSGAGILNEMPVILPSTIEEEKQIADYFIQLDNLITLHQRKCDQTKNLKKYMLQKMFPQNGAKVPEIRFDGFTYDWEQRKVGDLLEERNEQAPMSEDYPLMAFIANQGVAPKGERYDRSALVNDETGKKYKKTEFGDFIYSSNNLETGSIGLNKYGNACISPVYSIFKPTGKAELDFLGRRFLRKDFINEMVKWRQGVVYGQWKIHETDFMKIEVRIPSVDEQKKIGQYFDSLDHLITLHQRKCDELKKMKKYMLQNMFI